MLKGQRSLNTTEIMFVSEAAMEAGTVCVYKASQPTGAAVGDGLNAAAPVAIQPPSGGPASGAKVAGLLIDSVVTLDTTRQHRNFHKTEQLVGENICLLKDGFVYTNWVLGTPAAGDPAFIGPFGKLQTTQVNAVPAVGKFETAKDGDGYARVSIKVA